MIGWAEAKADRLLLLCPLQEKCFKIGRGFPFYVCYPRGVECGVRMIGPERPFFGIDGDDWQLETFSRESFCFLLDDEVFIENGGTEIRGATFKELAGKKAGATAVVNDTLLGDPLI